MNTVNQVQHNLVINGVYKHYKGGLYRVLGVGLDVDNMMERVIYKNILNDSLWTRGLNEFESDVEVRGYTFKRFELLEERV